MKMKMPAKCRTCGKIYDAAWTQNQADVTGYCSKSCQHEMAKECGYRKPRKGETDSYIKSIEHPELKRVPSEIQCLRDHNQIGTVKHSPAPSAAQRSK